MVRMTDFQETKGSIFPLSPGSDRMLTTKRGVSISLSGNLVLGWHRSNAEPTPFVSSTYARRDLRPICLFEGRGVSITYGNRSTI